MRVQECAGHLFCGVGGTVIIFENEATRAGFLRVVDCAELPHHAVFIGLAEFFGDFRREKRRFPEALTPERTAELAGSALFFC